MRPSMPMSPTCALLGMPPRAMTAQFSNSNGGMLAQLALRSTAGRGRRSRARSARASRPRGRSHTSRSRLAMTRQAVGEMSMPIHWRPRFCGRDQRRAAAAEGVEDDVVRVAAGLDDALKQRQRLLRRIAERSRGLRVDRVDVVPDAADGNALSTSSRYRL